MNGALHRVRELLGATPLAEVIAGEDIPTEAVPSGSDAALAYVRHHGGTAFHAVGSCAMGQAADSVLDPQLRVRGIRGLRVVDASRPAAPALGQPRRTGDGPRLARRRSAD